MTTLPLVSSATTTTTSSSSSTRSAGAATTTTSSRSDQCHITLTEAVRTFTNPGYVVENVDKRLWVCWKSTTHLSLIDGADLTTRLCLLCSIRVGASNRSILTFLDSVRLQLGYHFQLDFAKALVKSSVIVPFVTRNALGKMTIGRQDE